MDTKNYILQQILKCWYSDVEFLVDLVNEYDVDLYEFEFNDFNSLVYAIYENIASNFLDNVKIPAKSQEYTIFTNYLDSSLYFTNPKTQEKFEKRDPKQ
jgi:hypothetical protein